MSASTTDAERLQACDAAITHLLHRLQNDARVAWHFDPITKSFEDLTRAHALCKGLDVDEFRRTYAGTLTFEAPPSAPSTPAHDGRDELLAVVRMVANLGEYRQLVERMADCLRPHERPAFERLFRQDARAALFAAGEPR